MAEEFVIRRRPARSSPLRARRVGAALSAAPAARRPAVPFPGLPDHAEGGRNQTLVSGAFSTLLHAAIAGGLIALTWLSPVIQEEIPIPVELLHEEPVQEPEPEPAPAPKALAERRAAEFAPQAQALRPQIINPTVVARAAPAQDAERLEMNQVAGAVTPRQISAAHVVVEHTTAVQSVVAAQASKVDVTAATPALRGPTEAELPSGPSVGPRAIATTGSSVGTGTDTSLGDTSSVREGVASTRDVLGSPDGKPLANVNTRVGEGLLRGDGGSGSGGAERDCLARPEVQAYTEQMRKRVYERWHVSADVPQNQQVKIRIALDLGGSLTKVELVGSSNQALATNAMEALRAAAPFPPMPERIRCLAGKDFTSTWSVRGDGNGGG